MNLAVLQFQEGLLHDIEGASRDFSGGALREYYFSVRIGHVESLLEPGILHFECGGIQSFEYSEPVVDIGHFPIEEISGRMALPEDAVLCAGGRASKGVDQFEP